MTLRLVAGVPVSRLWNEYVQRYHYLGYTAMSGSQLRYNVYAGDKLVALLSFGASAWKLAGCDNFIGWQEPQRGKKSRVHQQIIPVKDIWLYPLRQNFRTVLCA